MRIGLFHDLPSGGAKRSLRELVKRLAPHHRIDLYRLATADEQFCDLRPFTTPGRVFPFAPRRLFRSPLGRLNQLQRWRDLRDLVRQGRSIAATLDAGGYDALFVDASMWTQAPPLLCFTATPSLYNFHEPPRALYEEGWHDRSGSRWHRALDRVDPFIALYRAAARRLDREATRAATRVLVNSAFTQRTVREIYGIASSVTERGVDSDQFRPRPDLTRRREVLSVGALQPNKGFEFLIDSVARIPSHARPPLRLIGNAERSGHRAALSRLAAAHGVALTIERDVPDELLAQRYAEAALFVYAPHREPLGLAPVEAMSCGTPVVAVAEGGVMETVVADVTGRLVARDASEFGEAVAALLADPAARLRLGANARQLVVERWSWDRSAGLFEKALGELTAGGASLPPVAAGAAR